MYLDERTRKDGTVQYRFTYYGKDGKRRRFPQRDVPAWVKTRDDAIKFAKSQAAIIEAKKAYIARKLSWRSQYHDFEDHIKTYSAWQQERAPNSWKACAYYLEQWVFPFYLTERGSNNPNNWHLHFQEFKDWLAGPKVLEKRGQKGPLAISTRNNVINALNTFLRCLSTYGKIDPASVKVCEKYPEHMLNRKDMDDVIDKEERDIIVAKLRQSYEPAADFFLVLWHTGMRFAELFGLPVTALFRGEIEAGPLKDELTKYGMDYVGYIYLESQPLHDDKKREEDKQTIRRKALKGCKEISPRFARVIPIRDKEVWNILARRYKAQTDDIVKGKYGPDKINYMLFQDAEWNKTVVALREAYDGVRSHPKGYHCCRHSFVTRLVGETRSYFLVRMITGHRSQKAFERYLHLHEKIARQVKQKEQTIDELD